MDNSLERYRGIVRHVIEKYSRFKPSHGDIRTEKIFDLENDHYELVHVGWDGVNRIHGSVHPHRHHRWEGVGRARRHRCGGRR